MSSNEQKYQSKNPLKKLFLHQFTTCLRQIISDYQIETVLDVGCGEALLAEKLFSDKDIVYTGIDVSKVALVKAQQRFPQGRFRRATIDSLPFRTKFDLVLCCEVLEHIQNPQQAVLELLRVTKQVCIITVPDEPMFTILRFLSGYDIFKLGRHPEHINFWNRTSLSQFLSDLISREILITRSLPWLISVVSKV